MNYTQINSRKFQANDGYIFVNVNDNTIQGKKIILSKNDSIDNWMCVTEDEASILYEQALENMKNEEETEE